MKIKHLKIGTRLALGFGFVCMALVFMVGQGLVMLSRVNEVADEIASKRIPGVELVTRQQGAANNIAIALRDMMLSDDRYDKGAQALMRLVQSGDAAGARTGLSKELRPVLAAYQDAIREQITIQSALSAQTALDAKRMYSGTRT